MPLGERWSGLKGKPQSADMGFLMRTHCHRFPLPDFNTWGDRCKKEQLGQERLIRRELNEWFAGDDDDDESQDGNNQQQRQQQQAQQNLPQLPPQGGGHPAQSFFTRSASAQPMNRNIYAASAGSNNSATRTGGRGSVASNPFSPAGAAATAAIVAAAARGVPSNNGNSNRPDSAASSLSRSRSPRTHSASHLLVGKDGLAHIQAQKLATLSAENAKRLTEIWPQVGLGWQAKEVQKKLATEGRDNDHSPLRTLTARSASAMGILPRHAAGRNQQQYQQSPRNTNNNAANDNQSAVSAATTTTSFSSSAYNRRVRAPSIPEPFLGKRGTSRQLEEQSTALLLRKLNDLEEEIRTQQDHRSEMQQHVQELKAILLQRAAEPPHPQPPPGSEQRAHLQLQQELRSTGAGGGAQAQAGARNVKFAS